MRLFTIFINDHPDEVNSLCKIFADDAKIYDISTNYNRLQENLNRLQNWSDKWNLYFNVVKCKVLHGGKNNPEHDYNMKMKGVNRPLQKFEGEKDFSVIFDKDLSFDTHIQKCINKANQMTGLIKRTFCYLNKDTFLKLYKAMVRPHLEYENVIWYTHLKRQSTATERVQRRATKLLHELFEYTVHVYMTYMSYTDGRGDLIEVYKIFHAHI